ncbi:PLC-like phosphodiesterase [Rhodocollybia butyracea]|uniref:Phosphoinositide phospholipase C n=1 Tax=Rhodocollybia butyracea TaxID=206335 RepID=A0A9P5U7U2_9AGAR|nr:PLC-like phosphodiesterase [Rhodocollybia butyracea]
MDARLHAKLQELYRVDFLQNVHPPKDERLSSAIEEFIQTRLDISKEELLGLPVVSPPEWDDAQPLTHYFVSSSHNTYLLSRQLIGRASAESYTHALSRGARVVEIDVWPSSSPEGLVVTHGYTLTKGTSFRKVCEAIGAGVDALGPDAWPVMVSLECHVGPEGQVNMVNILKDVWGEKLVVGKLNDSFEENIKVPPKALKGRIVLMVEYYAPSNFAEIETKEAEAETEAVDDSERYEDTQPAESVVEGEDLPEVLVGKVERGKISDELAALGYYARSWKPSKGWLQQELVDPRHILINISESSVTALLPAQLDPLVEHGRRHLRRIFPKGTRIRSSNMDILKFWRNGSHVVSLNWQTFDAPMQINEAMFVGSPGWVLKPQYQRSLNPDMRKVRFRAEVVGISSLPAPKGHENNPFHVYVVAELYHSQQDQTWRSKTVKTADEGDAMWNEEFEWEYENDELAFVRLRIRQNRKLEKDLDLAVFCARVDSLHQGWRLVHMMNMDGKSSGATLLMKFGLH